ncbi:hypothetical protein [Massilia endophytica]|uniref:hypothetical protein n=1 Tax=Massilia endophytica TaxID=2899220 RepID=UPI001E51427D|nr:hypothetical protein [Massilia endophytica]UGQ48900.1 hypothetical protein LSQ66_10680 [Massilia endophytica]
MVIERPYADREEFLQRYLKPLLIDPLQDRLNSLPDFLFSQPDVGARLDSEDSVNEKSGASASLLGGQRAVFVPGKNGWHYHDHVLLSWKDGGELVHSRQSEQDLRFGIVLSEQPDMAGTDRLTVDINASLMRYEWDSVGQRLPDGRATHLGKGWARVTLQWSLRVQCIAGADGRVHVVARPRKSAPVMDARTLGAYLVSDPLQHLMNMPRITHGWEHGAASMAAVQGVLVARLAAAIEPVLRWHED